MREFSEEISICLAQKGRTCGSGACRFQEEIYKECTLAEIRRLIYRKKIQSQGQDVARVLLSMSQNDLLMIVGITHPFQGYYAREMISEDFCYQMAW